MTSTNPRPQKRSHVIDKNEVDIFGSDYGDDILMENEAGPSGTIHRYALTSLPLKGKETDDATVTKETTTITPPSFASSIQNGSRVKYSSSLENTVNTPLSCYTLGKHNPEKKQTPLEGE